MNILQEYDDLFYDLPGPAIIVDDTLTSIILNPAAEFLCSSIKANMPNVSISCRGSMIFTWIGDELGKFINNKDTESHSFYRNLNTGSVEKFFNVYLKRIVNDKILIVLIDKSESHKFRHGFNELIEGVLSNVGDEFFNTLVLHLVRASKADHAFICEFTDESKRTVRTVAVCADGEIVPNFEFNLETTPCNLVVNQGFQAFDNNVCGLFPLDHLALQMGVESYYGIPLTDSMGNVLGPMAVMGRDVLPDNDFAISMLKLFAMRASAELERKHIEDKQKQNIHMLQSILDAIPNPIFYKDIDGVYLGCNKSLEKCVGLSRDEIIGKTVYEIAPHEWADQCSLTDKFLIETGECSPYEASVQYADGENKNVIFSKALFSESDQIINGVVGTIIDITDRKKAEEKVKKLAYYDVLTGLPNRQLLKDRLDQHVARTKRCAENLGVLFVDLDRFKNVNDTLGHSLGDRLLQEVSERLKHCLRESDTVARLGGDEFVIILPSVKHEQYIADVADKLLDVLSKPVDISGHDIYTSLSIGVAVYPYDGTTSDDLLKNADTAMYQAKEHGRNTYRFYSEEMNQKAVKRLSMENSLRAALGNNEMFLNYQPQVDTVTKKVIGVEALLRWDRKGHGLISPAEFIPLAEDTGVIFSLSDWVMKEACRQQVDWIKQGLEPVKMSVNISVMQFKQKNFLDKVVSTIKETGINPQHLELELTESMLMDDHCLTREILCSIREMGLYVSIDDFGTGYSSLSYLRNFPINRLKIDRSFIKNLDTDQNNKSITQAIVGMAKSLNMEVIAEGVETIEECNLLQTLECSEVQGFYFCRPVTPSDFVTFVKSFK